MTALGDAFCGPVPFKGNKNAHGLAPFTNLIVTSDDIIPLHVLAMFALIVSIAFPTYLCVLKDYRSFLALGPGGTPSTFRGYLRITWLKLIYARNDVFTAPPYTPYEHPAQGYLTHLPSRMHPRPKVRGIAPHRQITQRGTPAIHTALSNAIGTLRDANSALLTTGISFFEKHDFALFFAPRPVQIQVSRSSFVNLVGLTAANPRSTKSLLVDPLQNPCTPGTSCCTSTSASLSHDLTNPDDAGVAGSRSSCVKSAEIVHLHTMDSSMHLTLHPSDAALVLEKGWGEMHPLAGRGPWVPKGFTMVYAPVTEEDVGVIVEIIKAAGWWVGGCLLKSDREKFTK
ncbi:hypothetical protein MMC25_007944 [Agyrium rufum]|nr:hypothetical protein [Agyrium rufum]